MVELVSVRNGRMKARGYFEVNSGGEKEKFLRIEDGDKVGGGRKEIATTRPPLRHSLASILQALNAS